MLGSTNVMPAKTAKNHFLSSIYMFYALKIYFRDIYIWLPLALSVLILGGLWWYIMSHIHPTGDQIFLHYNIIFGIDLAGSWQKMYYLGGEATGVVIVNYIAAFFLHRDNAILARITSLLTVPLIAFVAYAIVLIVGLNI